MANSETLKTEIIGATLVISLFGRINHERSDELTDTVLAEIARSLPHSLLFDLSEVDYMSSAGLRVLMLASKACKARNAPLVISGLQPSMVEIFQISRFDKVFSIFETRAQALDSLASP